MSTTSTVVSIRSVASAADSACTVTSIPSKDASRPTIPRRKTGWSSTTATLIG
jgi:hypothetical protein